MANSAEYTVPAIIPTLDLNDGRAFPQLGLGIYAMKGDEGVDAIVGAVDDVGYRQIGRASCRERV